jgi:hypothetical protein
MRRNYLGREFRRTSAGILVDVNPLSILGGGTSVKQWVRADLGITLNGSTVSTWADQSGNGNDYSQGTAANQPTWGATSGPNNTPALTFNGTTNVLTNSSFSLGLPIYVWMIIKALRSTGFDTFIDDNTTANHIQIGNNNLAPNIRMANITGSNVNGALTNSTWARVKSLFSNSTSDFLQVITTNVAGANAGANTAAGRRIGLDQGATAPANIVVAELFYANRNPTAAEETALNAYATARYGSGLV